MIGVGCDADGPAAAPVDSDVAASLVDFDKGPFEESAVDIALFDDSAGLVFSLAMSEEPAGAGKSDVIGVVEGIETSLRRPPCEPAPSLLDLSSSVISTVDGCDVELDMLDPWPRPDWPVDCVGDAIGRVYWGEM